jgi:hypothetical protein
VSFLDEGFNVRQFLRSGALQNAFNVLVRQQKPATKILNVRLGEFGVRLFIAPVKKVNLKLSTKVGHLETFDVRFAWLFLLRRDLEIEELKRLRVANITANGERSGSAVITPPR